MLLVPFTIRPGGLTLTQPVRAEDLISQREAADILGITPNAVAKLIERRQLISRRQSLGLSPVTRASLEEVLRRRAARAARHPAPSEETSPMTTTRHDSDGAGA